jgi:hypothetical protein
MVELEESKESAQKDSLIKKTAINNQDNCCDDFNDKDKPQEESKKEESKKDQIPGT